MKGKKVAGDPKSTTIRSDLERKFDPEFTIWKDFEKECKKYHVENINFLKSNFNIIEKLNQKNRNYIKKHYNI